MAKFKPGESGNPAGRPKRTDTERALRDKLRKATPDILDRLLKSASEGDTTAAKLLLERSLPPLRPVDAPVNLPVTADADMLALGRAAMAGLADGSLTPIQAREILTGIGALARISEVAKLAARITVIEESINGKNRS